MARSSEVKAERALRFVEELSWLLRSYDNVDLKGLADVVKRNLHRGRDDESRLSQYVGSNARSDSLIGILPKIFMNPKWFESNSDIADFAQAALGMRIPRWEKISKFEMIGHIVCNLALKERRTHTRLVEVLTGILADKDKEKFVTDMRRDQMSWNEIIRRFG